MSSPYLFWFLNLQGLFLLANGLFMLVAPEQVAETGALRGTPREAMLILSMSTISLGSLYILCGIQRNHHLARLSVAGRVVATIVFAREGGALGQVAWIEVFFGVITAFLMVF